MGKSVIKRLIAGYFLVFFGAVFLRVDYFPFSWVPMYGFREESEFLTVAIGDIDRRELGFAAVRANGERTFLSRRDLNIPPANFRRLYQERAFGEGPPQHQRERAQLMAFNRWWYETLIGPDPAAGADYPRQVLNSVNRTFRLGETDPRRFVRLEVALDFATYTREQLDTGNLRSPVRERRTAIITPQGTKLVKAPIRG
jgi:hypothetical protein